MSERIAVVLFNLGGPDRPESVRPFLFNLFNDSAIIAAPGPIRWCLAQVLSRRRAPVARKIYARLGGRSPLLAQTCTQAHVLKEELRARGHAAEVFVCMRYWHPNSDEAAEAVATYTPDRIVLLPLYPQFSTTTTGSSLAAWRRAAAARNLTAVEHAVCCYPWQEGWITAQADLVRAALAEAGKAGRPRVLFSAHGLPKRVVANGDPYQWHVERTAAAVVEALDVPDLDRVVCYQSRVGPLQWLEPFTENEIVRAGADRVPVVVVPVAFVSEHSETLVELDEEYAEKARAAGVPAYVRVPAVGTHASFIGGLAEVVEGALRRPAGTLPDTGVRLCPAGFSRCPCTTAA